MTLPRKTKSQENNQQKHPIYFCCAVGFFGKWSTPPVESDMKIVMFIGLSKKMYLKTQAIGEFGKSKDPKGLVKKCSQYKHQSPDWHKKRIWTLDLLKKPPPKSPEGTLVRPKNKKSSEKQNQDTRWTPGTFSPANTPPPPPGQPGSVCGPNGQKDLMKKKKNRRMPRHVFVERFSMVLFGFSMVNLIGFIWHSWVFYVFFCGFWMVCLGGSMILLGVRAAFHSCVLSASLGGFLEGVVFPMVSKVMMSGRCFFHATVRPCFQFTNGVAPGHCMDPLHWRQPTPFSFGCFNPNRFLYLSIPLEEKVLRELEPKEPSKTLQNTEKLHRKHQENTKKTHRKHQENTKKTHRKH